MQVFPRFYIGNRGMGSGKKDELGRVIQEGREKRLLSFKNEAKGDGY